MNILYWNLQYTWYFNVKVIIIFMFFMDCNGQLTDFLEAFPFLLSVRYVVAYTLLENFQTSPILLFVTLKYLELITHPLVKKISHIPWYSCQYHFSSSCLWPDKLIEVAFCSQWSYHLKGSLLSHLLFMRCLQSWSY